MKTEKGKFITLTTGSYSDYRLGGTFEVLKTFDMEQEKESHRDEDGFFFFYKFIQFLIDKGLIRKVESEEVNFDGDGYIEE